MRRLLIILLAAVAAILPSSAFADNESDGGFVLRVNGDYTLPAGSEVSTVIVLNGDATIAGTVRDAITVVGGDAVVSGRVDGDITVVRGDLTLSSVSVVHNVRLVRSDLVEHQGATVTGSVDHTSRFFLSTGWAVLFGIVFFVGLGVALMAVAIGFALVAGRQLGEAAASMTGKAWQTIATGIIAVVALPVIGALAVASLIGFWIGLGIFLVLMPVLAVLGVVVAATWLGLMVTNHGEDRPQRPIAAAALGTIIMLVLFAIPGVNVLAMVVFATWGVGAIAFMAVQGLRGTGRAAGAGRAVPPAEIAQPQT